MPRIARPVAKLCGGSARDAGLLSTAWKTSTHGTIHTQLPPIWHRFLLPPPLAVTLQLIWAKLAMPDKVAAGISASSDLARLYKAIAETLEEADRLELRMVGIHLCNALHSLDEELTRG